MNVEELNDSDIKQEVLAEIEIAREFARQINFEQVKSGEWFLILLRQVVQSYQTNARTEYFQQKYPGLEADDIADKLIFVTNRYASIAGAVTGLAISANQLATLSTMGMTAALFVTSMGAEMIYLTRLQIRLVLDLAIAYDLQLDPDDPEDILMIFGYAVGVTPSEFLGKGLQIAAGAGTKNIIKTHVSKATLKSVQAFAKKLGFKILQRTIIKYAVPAVSMAVGSSFNYASTKAVGQVAKVHFKNRGKVTDELRLLISKQHTYALVYPASILYIAKIDGVYNQHERDFYEAILSRMNFDEYDQSAFQDLLKHEEKLLEHLASLDDRNSAETMFELLVLMAIYDGDLAIEELDFLEKAAYALNIEIDMDKIQAQVAEYKIDYDNSQWQKIAETTSNALGASRDATVEFVQNSTRKTKHIINQLWRRDTNDNNNPA